MRKDIIQSFMKSYDSRPGTSHSLDNPFIKFLREFLTSKAIEAKNKNDDISVEEFLDFIPPKEKDRVLKSISDDRAFTKFYTEFTQPIDPSALSATSMFAERGGIPAWLKLRGINLNEKITNKLIELDIIGNYDTLVTAFSRLPESIKNSIDSLGPLLCLSGEIQAIEYGINEKLIDPKQKDFMLYLYFSGNKNTIEHFKKSLKIKMTLEEQICLAARSGHVALLKDLLKDLRTKDENAIMRLKNYESKADQSTLLHEAARSGSPEMITYVLDTLNLDPNILNKNGVSPLHLAAETGRIDAIKALLLPGPYATKIKNPLVEDDTGKNLIAYAKLSSNPAAVDYINTVLSQKATPGKR